MQQTWKDVESLVTSLLKDDPVDGKSTRKRRYEPNDLISWWNQAQVRLATTAPIQKHEIYDQVQAVSELPKWHYKPHSLRLEGGQPVDEIEAAAAYTNNQGFYVYEGKLALSNLPPNDKGYSFLYRYYAYYPRIEKESSKIYVPQWGIEACATYVMMLATTREAMADARYRKFITRTDAGHPQQNPFIPVLKWLKERFYEIVSVHVDDVKPR